MFNKIDISMFERHMTKYPNGKTIFEALSETITSYNDNVDIVNRKVNEGLLAIDAAYNTLHDQVTALFSNLETEYNVDFTALQDQVNLSLSDKAKQTDLDALSAQLAEKVPYAEQISENTIIRKVYTVIDEFKASTQKFYKRNNGFVIQPTDVTSLYTSYTNLNWARILKKPDAKDYNSAVMGNTTTVQNYTEYTGFVFNDASNIGKYSLKANASEIWVGIPKGTTLSDARVMLTGTVINYQLPTTLEIDLPLLQTPNTKEILRLSELVNKLQNAIIALGGTII